MYLNLHLRLHLHLHLLHQVQIRRHVLERSARLLHRARRPRRSRRGADGATPAGQQEASTRAQRARFCVPSTRHARRQVLRGGECPARAFDGCIRGATLRVGEDGQHSARMVAPREGRLRCLLWYADATLSSKGACVMLQPLLPYFSAPAYSLAHVFTQARKARR